MEPHTGLNNLDYLVLGAILLSGLLALMRGFIREMFSLLAWSGAYFVAARYHVLAEPWAHRYIKSPSTAAMVAAIGVFCVTFIVLSLIGFLVARLIRGQALTAIDRSLGFIFGILRGGLVVCLLYLGAVTILWPDIDKPQPTRAVSPPESQAQNAEKTKEKLANTAPEWVMESKTQPFLAYGAAVLRTFIPDKDFEKSGKEYLEEKASAQHLMDQKALDMLSTPTASSAAAKAPSYDDKSRSGLDQLIDQKGGQ